MINLHPNIVFWFHKTIFLISEAREPCMNLLQSQQIEYYGGYFQNNWTSTRKGIEHIILYIMI